MFIDLYGEKQAGTSRAGREKLQINPQLKIEFLFLSHNRRSAIENLLKRGH